MGPRRLLHHRQRCLRFLSGTLVNRLHRLRDYRHAQWSKCSSLSPSARRSARRSVTRYLAYGTADRLLSRCGGRLPEIRTIGTRSNLDPWILPMDPVGCVFWLAVYFFYFPYWTSPSYGTTYIIYGSKYGQICAN